jgi:hypothetical protein
LDDGRDISNLPAVKYGREKEPEAKREYERRMGVKIQPAGLVVSKKHAWLCASPDGIIKGREEGQQDTLLEIKCPYSCRNKGMVDVPYYKMGVGLLKSHAYYTQIQLQLYVCDLQLAELMIYVAPGTWNLSHIWRDDKFLDELIPKLEKLYFENLLPQLAAEATPTTTTTTTTTT